MLNQKFRGRTLARAVFFMPAIIATGPVYKIISGDMDSTGNTQAAQFSTLFSTDLIGSLLQFLGIYGISDRMSGLISGIADNIFGIVWSSGIQILLFLGALQNIPPSAKEAAQIEGATAWEFFWKITLPYVSPFILANLIFTVIDSFTSPTNAVMERILSVKEELKFGAASAMAWGYFIIIAVAIGLLTFIVNKFIYYEND
jgi:ABC-type sugar transport system permease subunit